MSSKEKFNLLVTAFPSFDETNVNSSELVVSTLKDRHIGKTALTLVTLPNSFARVDSALQTELDQESYDATIALGQAGGTSSIRLERIALNYADATPSNRADADGARPFGVPIIKDGPLAYETLLPVQDMVETLVEKDLPIEQSYYAGTQLCNYVYYLLLHHSRVTPESTPMPALFLHVPYLDIQAPQLNTAQPTIPLETAIEATQATIELVVRYLDDISSSNNTT